ncbi:unnamed protein product [Caenorhabditis nigoni]
MKNTTRLIYGIHVLCFLPVVSIILINQFIKPALGAPVAGDNKSKQEFIFNTFSIIFNSIFITSVFLYIPIYISIFRLRHLPSVEKHKPQKYILYQTFLAFFLKTIQLIIITFYPSSGLDGGTAMSTQTDVLLTPFLIQLPYLFCNRRNVNLMRKRISLRYLWSKIGSRNLGNRVGIAYIQSTTI